MGWCVALLLTGATWSSAISVRLSLMLAAPLLLTFASFTVLQVQFVQPRVKKSKMGHWRCGALHHRLRSCLHG